MKYSKYILKIKGLKTGDGTVSVVALRDILNTLIESSEKALRLAIEGTSTKKGQLPAWLKNSVDFTVTGLKKGSTTLQLLAPRLSGTAARELTQPDLWNIMPKPEDTALSILVRAVKDVERDNPESNFYDNNLLKNLLIFDNVIGSYAESIELLNAEKKKEKVVFDNEKLEKISSISFKIPEPQKVILSGYFNEIEHAEGKFRLRLENGDMITGEIEKELIDREKMRLLWGNLTTIRGTAEFKANKKIRFLKADYIKKFEENERILLTNFEVSDTLSLFGKPVRYKKKKNTVGELWGKWPGNETIEELLQELTNE